MNAKGNLSKMRTSLAEEVKYTLTLGNDIILMNNYIGTEISLLFTGIINCIDCGIPINKTFGQGFCYHCFVNSPQNSECIIHPELCQAHLGKGRDVNWEKRHHLQKHFVYLALTSKLKVGVTRHDQIPTRWIDQGAWKALIIAETNNRYEAGLIEVSLKKFFGDKTPWRDMLKNIRDTSLELKNYRKKAFNLIPYHLQKFWTPHSEIMEIEYPVDFYPKKITSLNFNKTPKISGTLAGIRAQYLIFNNQTVLNIRKFAGYEVEFSAPNS